MAYTCKQIMGVGSAESLDGSIWLSRQNSTTREPILCVQPVPGGWDAAGVETPSVPRSPNGKYFLYYGDDRSRQNHDWAIRLAQSDDGYTWTKVGATPVFSGTGGWDSPFRAVTEWPGGVREPSIRYDPEQGSFKLW